MHKLTTDEQPYLCKLTVMSLFIIVPSILKGPAYHTPTYTTGAWQDDSR